MLAWSRKFRGAAIAPLAILVAWLLAVALPAAPALAATHPTAFGGEVLERFSVDPISSGLLLRPKATGTPVRTIELDDSTEEAMVNGKQFTGAELRDWLGEDGDRLARLLAMEPEDRLRELGLSTEEEETPAPPTHKIDINVPSIPPIPPIRVRAASDDRVSFGRSIVVHEDESARDVVCIGCSIDVQGQAMGNAVSVGGSVTVSGKVLGDAVSVGGAVHVDDGAEVLGEAVAVGGSVEVAPSGRVIGTTSSVGWGEGWFGRHGVVVGDTDFFSSWFSDWARVVWGVFRIAFLSLLAGLFLLIARSGMEATAARVRGETWKAALVGLLTQMLFFPVLVLVTVILAVSIIGIPLLVLVPFAILALVVAAFFGYAAVAYSIGRWVERRLGHEWSPWLAVVVGVVAIQGVSLVGRLVGLIGGWAAAFAFGLLALGFFFKYVAWTTGLGAAVMTLATRTLERRRGTTPGDGSPVPVVPELPPVPVADPPTAV
jgi:hypothetical protein